MNQDILSLSHYLTLLSMSKTGKKNQRRSFADFTFFSLPASTIPQDREGLAYPHSLCPNFFLLRTKSLKA